MQRKDKFAEELQLEYNNQSHWERSIVMLLKALNIYDFIERIRNSLLFRRIISETENQRLHNKKINGPAHNNVSSTDNLNIYRLCHKTLTNLYDATGVSLYIHYGYRCCVI